MSAPVQHPLPIPTDGLRQLSPKEQLQRAKAMTCSLPKDKKPGCVGNVFLGIFFDGTGNNMQDHYPKHGHSNVVRLHNAYPENPTDGFFRYYIPGVGTPFPQIGENSYSSLGKAVAKGGEQRINWGLVQVYNAVHRFLVNNQNLVPDAKAKTIVSNMSSDQLGLGGSYRRMVMRTWEDKLKAVIKSTKPEVQQINISVFGFSRGAAQARAFCNWFFELCEKKDGGYTLAGVPVRIYFLGIFDTVASVGLANLVSITEGHMAWADDNMHINSAVEQCVHFVAAHEIRACFPLDSARRGSSYPPNCKEVIYPGAHSNVGGGYMPNAQGKCGQVPDERKYAFAALMPAIDMYHEACKAGVPLLALHEMPSQIRRDFDPDPDLVKAYNAFLKKSGVGAQSLENAMKSHMSLYYRYRKLRLNNLLDVAPYTQAPAEDREFLKITNADFREGVRILEGTDQANKDAAQNAAAYHKRLQHSLAYPDKNNPVYLPRKLQPMEQDILDSLKNPQPLSEEVIRFFDYYVHDSLAGFAQDGVHEYSYNRQGHLRHRKIFVDNG